MPEMTDSNGRVRRTDAKRTNLDIFDAILIQEQKVSKMDIPEQIYDYPEHVLDTLLLFNKIWMLPHRSIPQRLLKGRFEQWINELNEINELCGSQKNVEEAMNMSLKSYESMKNRFPVSHPSAIRKLIIAAMGDINRRKAKEEFENKKEEEKKLKEAQPIVDSRKFRNLRKGE
jgi:exonuclease III